MSVLKFSSARPLANLELRHMRRAGSLTGVGILLNGALVEHVAPEGFATLVAWLRAEANKLESVAKQRGEDEG